MIKIKQTRVLEVPEGDFCLEIKNPKSRHCEHVAVKVPYTSWTWKCSAFNSDVDRNPRTGEVSKCDECKKAKTIS